MANVVLSWPMLYYNVYVAMSYPRAHHHLYEIMKSTFGKNLAKKQTNKKLNMNPSHLYLVGEYLE